MKLSTLGRYIDQPVILNKLQKKMPALLITAGAGYGIIDSVKFSKKHDEKESKKHAVKNAIIISTTIAASLIGTRGLTIGGKKVIKGLMENEPLKDLLLRQEMAFKEFATNTSDKKILKILEKVKTKELSPKDVETVLKEIPESEHKKKLLSVILPDKKNLESKEIFSEIKRLSILGAVPVVGGITGGIIADGVTNTSSKKSVSNKIKEGFYQYFANIFLCNVGAGASLYCAEKLQKAKVIKPLTSGKKLAVILTGITATGIIGGSFIANFLSKKIIDPMFSKNKHHRGLYDERKPEVLDVALHADDIATAGVLSGFKWIEPALPLMYFISGYRAGIGYRNNKKN